MARTPDRPTPEVWVHDLVTTRGDGGSVWRAREGGRDLGGVEVAGVGGVVYRRNPDGWVGELKCGTKVRVGGDRSFGLVPTTLRSTPAEGEGPRVEAHLPSPRRTGLPRCLVVGVNGPEGYPRPPRVRGGGVCVTTSGVVRQQDPGLIKTIILSFR